MAMKLLGFILLTVFQCFSVSVASVGMLSLIPWRHSNLEVIMLSPLPLLGHPFTISLLEVCWYEGVGMGLVLKYEDKETK